MKHLIAPSLLSADFGHLAHDIEMVNKSKADWLHLDVMDGVFVPNISFGFPVIESIRKLTKKPLDVHLMIIEPDRYIERSKKAGANILTVHFEACTHLHRTLQAIRDHRMKAGVSLNPHTPVSVLDDIITQADLVLLMSVNPGFGGQKFIENTYKKIRETRSLIRRKRSSALIEIDGGVDLKNAGKLIKAGADILVAGNAVFSSKNPIRIIADLTFSV
jgi:ribulose-phosphate 3-epimerase